MDHGPPNVGPEPLEDGAESPGPGNSQDLAQSHPVQQVRRKGLHLFRGRSVDLLHEEAHEATYRGCLPGSVSVDPDGPILHGYPEKEGGLTLLHPIQPRIPGLMESLWQFGETLGVLQEELEPHFRGQRSKPSQRTFQVGHGMAGR